MQNVAAIYEHGLLRPLEPLSLSEGSEVRLSVVETNGGASKIAETHHEPRQTPAQVLAEIATHAIRYGRVETAAADHDRFLYGPDGAR